MSNMPERIWATSDWRRIDQGKWWDSNPGGDNEEYIRADLAKEAERRAYIDGSNAGWKVAKGEGGVSAQQDRLDREMLRSMAASFSSGLGFSFNRQDMADLMMRMSERVDPRPRRADLGPAAPKVKALVEAAKAVEGFMRGQNAYERSGYGPKLRAAIAALEGSDG